MIRIGGRGKYKHLATESDDEDDVDNDQDRLRVEGRLNRRHEDRNHRSDAEDRNGRPEPKDRRLEPEDFRPEADADVETTFAYETGIGTYGVPGGMRPRHRKTSKSDAGEETAESDSLLGGGARGKADLQGDGDTDGLELSVKMLSGTDKSRSRPKELDSFFEYEIKEGDSLPSIALKFGCPVAALKRLNNFYSNQDIHSSTKLKVPIKKHGLISEILAEDERLHRKKKKRRKKGATTEDQSGAATQDTQTCVEPSGSTLRASSASPSQLQSPNYVPSASSSAGIRDLGNLFPHGSVSDCESGSDSRRPSSVGSDSEPSVPLVRTFYLSIRDNLSSSSSQSNLAKEFLTKMDADLGRIRSQNCTDKKSLDDVASSLSRKRIQPLDVNGASPQRQSTALYGTVLGMTWPTLLFVALVISGLLIFTFYTYGLNQGKSSSTSVSSNSVDQGNHHIASAVPRGLHDHDSTIGTPRSSGG